MMNHRIALICLILLAAVTVSAQRPAPNAATKPTVVRFTAQGAYEETFQGTTNNGNGEGKLVIKFEATRWLSMKTNEVGSAEFSDLANAPAPSVSGSVSYDGRIKRSDGYETTTHFAGPLGGDDIVLGVPEYTDTGNSFKIKVLISPKLKGKCTAVQVVGEPASVGECDNGTFFFTASTPPQTDDNDDPAKTADTPNVASFGFELDLEPEVRAAGNAGAGAAGMGGAAGEGGDYAWRGAVTSGSQQAGFNIALTKTKEVPSERGRSIRKLVFNATIVPAAPSQN
jgi:hypothetical protein